MEVGEMIAKVQKHFIDKLLSKEFEVVRIHDTELVMEIRIEGYPFCLWIANGRNHFKFYNDFSSVFMDMPAFTEEQKDILIPYIQDLVKMHTTQVIEEKIAELQSKIDQLKSSL